jgi:uncharacterized membrane protein YdjX (TVP38/TMEM64 family)
MQKTKKNSILVVSFIIIAILFFTSLDLNQYINFDVLKQNRAYLASWVDTHCLFSVIIYIVTYLFVAMTSIPIAAPLTMIGGFLFGVILATVYVNIGATLGAILIFLFIRYLLGKRIQKMYKEKLERFNKNMQEFGAYYLIIVRLVPLIPFFLINILAALTNISLQTFVFTTALGIIPGSMVCAYAGKQIGTINSPGEIFSLKIIMAFIILIFFACIPLILKILGLFQRNENESK